MTTLECAGDRIAVGFKGGGGVALFTSTVLQQYC